MMTSNPIISLFFVTLALSTLLYCVFPTTLFSTFARDNSEYQAKHGAHHIFSWNNTEDTAYSGDGYVFRTTCPNRSKPPKHLYVLRHTERLDFIYKWWDHSESLATWIDKAFNNTDNYTRVDLTMPLFIQRDRPSVLLRNSPQTFGGKLQSWLIGSAFKQRGLVVSHVYSSPTLRVLDSTHSILQGMGVDLPINVEPGLIEWPGWFIHYPFHSIQQLRQLKFNVNADYKPVFPMDKLNYTEVRLVDEYPRSLKIVRTIIANHRDQDGDILIVTHLSGVETLIRQLVGEEPLTMEEYLIVVNQQPYGVMSVLQQDCEQSEKWLRVKPPTPPMGFGPISTYNWTYLQSLI